MSDDPAPHPSHPAYQAQPGYLPAPGRPAENHRVLRLLALTAVGLGVLVLAAAAFLLSYPGIHAVALQAGVSASLARVYPVIFDAMLVIASAAVLALRGAGLVSRVYAWLSLLVLLAAAAGADALHATGIKPPHRVAAAVAAILPWALVLIGFALLLAMLRHARLHRAAAGRQPAASERPAAYRPAPPPVAALPPGSTPRAGNSRLVPAPPGPAAPAEAQPAHTVPGHTVPGHTVLADAVPADVMPTDEVPDPMVPADAVLPDPAVPADAGPADTVPAAPDRAGPDHAAPEPAIAGPAAPLPADVALGQPGADAPPPAFHRMWSSPTPPGEDDEG